MHFPSILKAQFHKNSKKKKKKKRFFLTITLNCLKTLLLWKLVLHFVKGLWMSIFHECILTWKLNNIHTSKTKKTTLYIWTSAFTYIQQITGHWSGNQRRQWHPTPVPLPGKSHEWRSLPPWGREKSDTTEWLHFHFSLSCTGEGNGNPLQCSCLENPRDGGAWWAAVYGVA